MFYSPYKTFLPTRPSSVMPLRPISWTSFIILSFQVVSLCLFCIKNIPTICRFFTKPWRIYAFSLTKWSVMFLPFWNPHWYLVMIYTVATSSNCLLHQWRLPDAFERYNQGTPLAIHPRSMAGLVEVAASFGRLLRLNDYVPCHAACSRRNNL